MTLKGSAPPPPPPLPEKNHNINRIGGMCHLLTCLSRRYYHYTVTILNCSSSKIRYSVAIEMTAARRQNVIEVFSHEKTIIMNVKLFNVMRTMNYYAILNGCRANCFT